MDKVLMSYLFCFLRYKTKCLIQLLFRQFDDVKNFDNYLPSTSKAMADREKKRERPKYKNLNISTTKRAFHMK